MPNTAISDSKSFGAGYIYGVQTVAPGGVLNSLLLPGQFATVQDATVDISKTVKELRGALEDAEDLADASRKITGKIATGRLSIYILNLLVFGEPGGSNFTTGTSETANNEKHSVGISASPTASVTNALTFSQDLGVMYTGTRLTLEPVLPPATPSQGEYSVASGVYTFNAADAGVGVSISYRFVVSGSGHTLTVNNLIMGSSRPSFQALFMNPYDGDQEILLYNCKATKVGFPIKKEDYLYMDLEFMASADTSGQTIQFLSSY